MVKNTVPPKGYFHSTILMQALRIGLLRDKQKRARAGRLLDVLPCFLLLAYCWRFLWDRDPTGWAVVLMLWAALACLAASIAACQDSLGGAELFDGRVGPSPGRGILVLFA